VASLVPAVGNQIRTFAPPRRDRPTSICPWHWRTMPSTMRSPRARRGASSGLEVDQAGSLWGGSLARVLHGDDGPTFGGTTRRSTRPRDPPLARVGEQIRDKALEGDGATVGHGRRQLGGELGVGHQPGPARIRPATRSTRTSSIRPPSRTSERSASSCLASSTIRPASCPTRAGRRRLFRGSRRRPVRRVTDGGRRRRHVVGDRPKAQFGVHRSIGRPRPSFLRLVLTPE